MSEQVQEIPAGVTLVTNENFDEYVDGVMGVPAEEAPVDDSPEAKAAEELKAIEAKPEPKQGDIDGSKVFHDGKWVGKHDFGYRVWLKSEEKIKEKDAALSAAETKAKAEAERAAAAEKAAQELKAKYEPPQSLVAKPEPQAGDFEDVAAYSKALKEWTANETRREDAVKAAKEKADQERKAAEKAWAERVTETASELPDFNEKISKSNVQVSDQMREAIFESEIGPKILYHLAENPDVAEALGKMPTARMLREFGKLEVTLGKTEKTPEEVPRTPLVEMVKPAPVITPLKGANTPVGLKINSKGEWVGTVDEFRAAHRAGKV